MGLKFHLTSLLVFNFEGIVFFKLSLGEKGFDSYPDLKSWAWAVKLFTLVNFALTNLEEC
jgi:hypothetical protein